MTLEQVERRLTELEKKIEELKLGSEVPARSGKWYVENSGQFKNDPVYAEIARLGRKYRDSLRPKTRGKKRR